MTRDNDIEKAGFNTKLVHGDDSSARVPDVVQPINVSTTFRYNDDPASLVAALDLEPGSGILDNLIYSRLSHPNSEKLEQVFEGILDGHVVMYSSGLAAFMAMLTHYNPKVIAIGQGYHGCHGIADIFTRLNGLKQIGLDDDYSQLGPGDIVHLETPVNPEGVSFDIKHYAEKAHARGAYLVVDSTLAPPPLQEPFKFGADMIMHSATKFFGGHSDLLAGCLVTKELDIKHKLIEDRVYLGTNVANLESFLLLRSLRTFKIRLLTQSQSAQQLVQYLQNHIKEFSALSAVHHSSLQKDAYIKEQLPIGHSPVFSIEVDSPSTARQLPYRLKYFHHATSLGGVESLVEWRSMTDKSVSQTLVRVSVGIEDVEDLIQDFHQALSGLSK
ncbi:BA75_00111T0 [Komagataella pastoris]|uniref:BA75_00111T0 n=1 Tax=Komagataella pastoris TaxID=4922 RepID=A0A1B2J9J5_PICPA|nr:BA75_00111T0 [Komagataella pastoris]